MTAYNNMKKLSVAEIQSLNLPNWIYIGAKVNVKTLSKILGELI